MKELNLLRGWNWTKTIFLAAWTLTLCQARILSTEVLWTSFNSWSWVNLISCSSLSVVIVLLCCSPLEKNHLDALQFKIERGVLLRGLLGATRLCALTTGFSWYRWYFETVIARCKGETEFCICWTGLVSPHHCHRKTASVLLTANHIIRNLSVFLITVLSYRLWRVVFIYISTETLSTICIWFRRVNKMFYWQVVKICIALTNTEIRSSLVAAPQEDGSCSFSVEGMYFMAFVQNTIIYCTLPRTIFHLVACLRTLYRDTFIGLLCKMTHGLPGL